MGDQDKPPLDEAAHGGGIGAVERQPVDPSTRRRGETEPDVQPAGHGVEAALATQADARASGEDPDEDADATLGTTA